MFGKASKWAAIIGLTAASLACAEGNNSRPVQSNGESEHMQNIERIADTRDGKKQLRELGMQILTGRTDAAAINAEKLWKATGGDVDSEAFNQFRAGMVELAEADSTARHFLEHDFNPEALTSAEWRKVHEINLALEQFRKDSKRWPDQLVRWVSAPLAQHLSKVVRSVQNSFSASQEFREGDGFRKWLANYFDEQAADDVEKLVEHTRWLKQR